MRQLFKVAVATATVVGFSFGIASAETLRFAGGPQGGAWYPLSGAIQGLIEDNVPGVNVQVQPGAGISNVMAINMGEADLGLGNAVTTVEGVTGRGEFPEPQEGVCQLLSLYFSYFHVVVPEAGGIETVADIAGARLTTAQRGNTGEVMARDVLAAHGITYNDLAAVVHGSFSDSVSQMRDGHVDVFTALTTIPAAAVMDLASGRDIRLINPEPEALEKMAAENPGYQLRPIPAGVYPGQDEEVSSFGTWTHVMARCDLDEDLAHDITQTIAENLPQLANVVAAISGTDASDLGVDIGVPMHPGAQRYFEQTAAR